MLRYLRSRIGSSYEIKDYDQDIFVSYTKLATHGFPQKVSCFALSENSGLLAIGTKDGRLQLYFPNGSQIGAEIEFPIISIYFIDTSKTIIFQYNNLKKEKNSSYNFFLGKVDNNRLELQNVFINELLNNVNYSVDKNIVNEINCCKVLDGNGNSALLLGTIIGDIYTFWITNNNENDLKIFIHFENTSLANVEELKTIQKRKIYDICINPSNTNKIVLLFDRSIIIIFDKLADRVLRKFVATNKITSICNDANFKSFYCSLSDGFYFTFNLNNEESLLNPKSYFEGNCFTKMSQIAISENESSEQFVIFSGGIPEDIECQNSICLFSGDNSLILNFDSEIINFKIFEEKGIALALFVLCQDEFVAIDLKDSLWRMFSLPYLHPIHSSPVTCILAISEISEQIMSIFEQISNQQKNFSKIFSSNKWPLERFEEDKISLIKGKKENSFLILTGHDNGNVCIWQANDLNFNLLLVCSTAKEFEGYQSEEENTQKVDEQNNNLKIPPIRKAGIFDPYSDDHRLCIQKICFDPKSGTFAVGGQAGQLLVFETLWKKSAPSNQQLLVDMTSNVEYSEYLDSGQNRSSDCAIQLRSLPINYEHGFCLYNNIVAQFKPPVPVTAISWNFNLGILAAGNEFGYAICSIIERKVLLVRTLISSSDVIQISSKDNALSRFKSVKKSIRQSFRRKKAPPSEHQANGVGIATHNNRHRQEREITQRKRNPNALDGETPNSLIKVLNFENCILSPFITKQVYLFVGTQGGSVLIHLIRSPDSCTNNERCQLIKEIRLRHHAPIIAIELLHQQPYPRLIVFSEEQIRSFILPTLKPSVYKYKLTAIEGSKIKKATCVKIANKTLTHKPEKFLAVITNRGEVFFISPINTKFIYKVHFVEPNNTIGIFTSVVTGSGQIYYINSGGSEFVRFGSHLLS